MVFPSPTLAQWYPLICFSGSRFPHKVLNPKRVPSLLDGYRATQETYPIVEKYARTVLQCVENVREKEKASDLKTLAASLATKLKAQSKNWIKTDTRISSSMLMFLRLCSGSLVET